MAIASKRPARNNINLSRVFGVVKRIPVNGRSVAAFGGITGNADNAVWQVITLSLALS